MEKRFQYWGFKDGKPQVLWTEWFEWDGEKYEWQLKNKLKNEYR